MTAFLLAATLLTLLVLAVIARPFLFGRNTRPDLSMAQLNTGILQEEISQLEREHARGTLSAEAFTAARDEVHRRLLEESPIEAPAPLAPRRAWITLLPLFVLLPLVGGALYAVLGTPNALNPAPLPPMAAGADPNIEKMVATLAAKLQAKPDNPEGWAMLGRSYKVMGRYAEAADAFDRVGPALEQNAGWLAQYADVLAMASGGKLAGKPEALAKKALLLEPDNLLALMLAGAAAAERKDYAGSVVLLQHALEQVPEDSEDSRFLKDAIAQGRAQLGSAAPGAAEPAATPAARPPRAAAGRTLALAVGIAPSLKAAAAGKTLFVIARAPGERMPIAVVKRSADSLPATITLDDSASLNPNRPLSSVGKLEIEARVSASGVAQSAPGDLFGVGQVADESVTALALQINQRRP